MTCGRIEVSRHTSSQIPPSQTQGIEQSTTVQRNLLACARPLRPHAANPFNATPHEGNGVAMLPRAVAVYTFVREPLSHFAAGGLAQERLDPYP